MLRRALASTLFASACLVATPASADDVEGPALRGPRVGITPGIGGGFAVLTSPPSAFSSFVGTTVLQAELFVEIARWGGFARLAYLSSGQDGRWMAPELAFGAQHRFLGDGETAWGLTLRAGVIYAWWNAYAVGGGCDVQFFIPQNCQSYSIPPATAGGPHPAPPPSASAGTLGPLLGVRLEAPLTSVYVAFGAEVAGMANVDGSSPGGAFTGQLTLNLALRDHPGKSKPTPTRAPPVRTKWQTLDQ